MRKKNGSGKRGAAQAPAIPVIDATIPDLTQGRAGTGGTGQTDAERIVEQLERQVVALKEAKLLAWQVRQAKTKRRSS